MLNADQLTSMRATVGDTLVDTCVIRLPPTRGALDTDTGTYVETPGAQVYSGPCRFGILRTDERVVESGGETVSLRTFRLRLPWDTIGVEVDQIVTAGVSNDPHLNDRDFRVVDVQGMTDPAGRSVIVEDNLG